MSKAELRRQPPYFETVRLAAKKRWDQLTEDEELAAPWHQLFRQVQSPRHVISELLQNADDAGAKHVSILVDDEHFSFQHDGHDFTKDEFQSLCRFGFSNKRRLLTIGFRGIGFRSAFSLGPRVEVTTPTLSCYFDQSRFTEPIWSNAAPQSSGTIIRVRFDKPAKRQAIESAIEHWKQTPVPILFFQSIRQLTLQGEELKVRHKNRGPGPRSEVVQLAGIDDDVVVFRSSLESFPDESVAEIREERNDPGIELPPSEVVIVLGAKDPGRVYVVLPTDLVLNLPVSCQAPFIQDPARTAIKDPANSPTNKWLLERIGRLLASSLRSWLDWKDESIEGRARAYMLLPDTAEGTPASLAHHSTTLVLTTFDQELDGSPMLLCSDGSVESSKCVAALPPQVVDTLGPEASLALFSPDKSKILARAISYRSVQKLKKRQLVETVEVEQILERLQDEASPPPSRPPQVERLIGLWAFLHKAVSQSWRWHQFWLRSALVPVEGRKKLGRAKDILSARTRPAECPEEDWHFLLDHVGVLDSRWSRLLRDLESNPGQTRQSIHDRVGTHITDEDLTRLRDAFAKTELSQTVRLEKVIEKAAASIFAPDEPSTDAGTRLLRIAARLSVDFSRIPADAPIWFLCRDNHWRKRDAPLLGKTDLDLEYLLPANILDVRLVSDTYEGELSRADRLAWRRWLSSPNGAGVQPFPPPEKVESTFWSVDKAKKLAQDRGGRAPFSFPLRSSNFRLVDYDWIPEVRIHWEDLARKSESIWRDVAWAMLSTWSDLWTERHAASIRQEGYSRSYSLDTGPPLRSVWLETIRGLPCLPDTFGKLRVPAELYRRTPDTLALLDVEPFLHEDWDVIAHEKGLDVLGVRSHAAGAQPLLDRLTALSKTPSPPIGALRDLYRALDRLFTRVDTHVQQTIRKTFAETSLIRAESSWERSSFVFVANPHSIPGVAVIHRELSDLSLWVRLEVSREPKLEDALNWLSSLAEGTALSEEDSTRIRTILQLYPRDVWTRVGKWLDMRGQIAAISSFQWASTNSEAITNLFPNIKAQIADLSMIEEERLSRLSDLILPIIEHHLRRQVVGLGAPVSNDPHEQRWLIVLGDILSRLRPSGVPDKSGIDIDRIAGSRMSSTKWKTATSIRIRNFLDGTPVGREIDVSTVWTDHDLYAIGSSGSIYRELVSELTRHFQSERARGIIRDCAARDPAWIQEYVQKHLELDSDTMVDKTPKSDAPETASSPPYNPLQKQEPRSAEATNSDQILDQDQVTDECEADTGEAPSQSNPQGKQQTESEKPRASRSDPFREYLMSLGFRWDQASETFTHQDGRTVRQSDSIFHWVLNTPTGEIHPIWLASSSLDSGNGVEIPAEVWNAAQNYDSFLLEPNNGALTPHRFRDLNSEIAAEEIELFASIYRLRRNARQ